MSAGWFIFFSFIYSQALQGHKYLENNSQTLGSSGQYSHIQTDTPGVGQSLQSILRVMLSSFRVCEWNNTSSSPWDPQSAWDQSCTIQPRFGCSGTFPVRCRVAVELSLHQEPSFSRLDLLREEFRKVVASVDGVGDGCMDLYHRKYICGHCSGSRLQPQFLHSQLNVSTPFFIGLQKRTTSEFPFSVYGLLCLVDRTILSFFLLCKTLRAV